MSWAWNKRYRHFHRYRQIGEILLRHGFGYLLQQTGLVYTLSFPKRLRASKKQKPIDQHLSLGARIRIVIEELGPTFIKFGQLLSTRPDVVPQDIIEELERLQDKITPVSYSVIEQQVATELGKPIAELYLEFDPEPIAAASIGQVHYARLLDGTEVVVKVKRPNLDKLIATDLEILYSLAQAFQDRMGTGLVNSLELVDQFARTIRKELDYSQEGRNIERFRKNFSADPNVVIPIVYWSRCTSAVLTMEYIRGIKVSDHAALLGQGVDLRNLADIIVNSFVRQVFTFGFYHGDPHPGNLLVTKAGKLALIDFGLVGRINERTKHSLARLTVAVTKRDIDTLVKTFKELDAFTGKPSREMELDIGDLLDSHLDKTLAELDFSTIVGELLELVRRYPIELPADLTLLVKALVTIEGVGTRLVPDYNVMQVIEPFAKEWVKKSYSFSYLSKKGFDQVYDWTRMLTNLPGHLDQTLETVSSGELEINFIHRGLEQLINRLDIVSNRLTVGVIIGALLVGSSLVLVIDRGPQLLSLSVFGLFGYVLAAILGFMLVISILRSGKY